MLRTRAGFAGKVGMATGLFALLMSLSVAVYADPPIDKPNPDCNSQGPERACEEDGDHNQGGRCDGNEGRRDVCDDPVAPPEGDDLGTTEVEENPDCNGTGPERDCEEDGDHNQGGPCDGNEGNRDDECDDEEPPPTPEGGPIILEKSGPAQAHVGDEITYTFEVTNLGQAAVTHGELTDDLLGTTHDLPTLTPAGTPHDSATFTETFVVPESAGDTVVNTAEACGQSQGDDVCDTDDHTVVVLQPGIDVTKVVDPASASPGGAVTFTYEVTNTGNVPLSDVTLVDDVIGDIGAADSLAEGERLTFTKEFAVEADSPTENVATACGDDVSGAEVCDTAAARFELVLPAGPRDRTPASGNLPSTGFPLLPWVAVALNLIAAGLAMTQLPKRERAA